MHQRSYIFCSEIFLCFYLQVTIQSMTEDDREIKELLIIASVLPLV